MASRPKLMLAKRIHREAKGPDPNGAPGFAMGRGAGRVNVEAALGTSGGLGWEHGGPKSATPPSAGQFQEINKEDNYDHSDDETFLIQPGQIQPANEQDDYDHSDDETFVIQPRVARDGGGHLVRVSTANIIASNKYSKHQTHESALSKTKAEFQDKGPTSATGLNAAADTSVKEAVQAKEATSLKERSMEVQAVKNGNGSSLCNGDGGSDVTINVMANNTTDTTNNTTNNTTTHAAAATYVSSSLYVGDLAPEVSEGKLFDIFNAVGPVASIRVCRDAMLKRSLGYAYFNFHAQADAERALETISCTAIMGRPCRIVRSQRDPSLRKSGVGNIIVKSLHPDVHHKELQDAFARFGNNLSCKLALDAEGKSKGYGYVHFQTDEAAKAAVDRMDEIEIMGTKVSIEIFQKKTAPQRAAKWTNLLMMNVPTHLTEADLTTMFAEHGKVQSLKLLVYSEEEVAKDAASGKSHGLKAGGSKGFGFVNFEEHEAAAAAAEALNGKRLPEPDSAARREASKAKAEEDKKAAVAAAVAAAKAAGGDEAKAGEEAAAKADAMAAREAAAAGDNGEGVPTRELFVGQVQKKKERERELKKKFLLEREKTAQSFSRANLYVKNLDYQLDEKSLDAAFKPYGTITSSRIMRHPDGASKGFGIVCYSSPEEANAASKNMNGKVLGGKPIFVALAQLHSQRREMLSQTSAQGLAGALPA